MRSGALWGTVVRDNALSFLTVFQHHTPDVAMSTHPDTLRRPRSHLSCWIWGLDPETPGRARAGEPDVPSCACSCELWPRCPRESQGHRGAKQNPDVSGPRGALGFRPQCAGPTYASVTPHTLAPDSPCASQPPCPWLEHLSLLSVSIHLDAFSAKLFPPKTHFPLEFMFLCGV